MVKSVSGLASLNEDKLKAEFISIGLAEDLIQKLILTVIALWVLQRQFEDKEDEWQLIAKKGRTYIKEQGYTGKIDKLFKLIDQDSD